MRATSRPTRTPPPAAIQPGRPLNVGPNAATPGAWRARMSRSVTAVVVSGTVRMRVSVLVVVLIGPSSGLRADR